MASLLEGTPSLCLYINSALNQLNERHAKNRQTAANKNQPIILIAADKKATSTSARAHSTKLTITFARAPTKFRQANTIANPHRIIATKALKIVHNIMIPPV